MTNKKYSGTNTNVIRLTKDDYESIFTKAVRFIIELRDKELIEIFNAVLKANKKLFSNITKWGKEYDKFPEIKQLEVLNAKIEKLNHEVTAATEKLRAKRTPVAAKLHEAMTTAVELLNKADGGNRHYYSSHYGYRDNQSDLLKPIKVEFTDRKRSSEYKPRFQCNDKKVLEAVQAKADGLVDLKVLILEAVLSYGPAGLAKEVKKFIEG